jgi:hypothetical protein
VRGLEQAVRRLEMIELLPAIRTLRHVLPGIGHFSGRQFSKNELGYSLV